jgi:hypothetical protein
LKKKNPQKTLKNLKTLFKKLGKPQKSSKNAKKAIAKKIRYFTQRNQELIIE